MYDFANVLTGLDVALFSVNPLVMSTQSRNLSIWLSFKDTVD